MSLTNCQATTTEIFSLIIYQKIIYYGLRKFTSVEQIWFLLYKVNVIRNVGRNVEMRLQDCFKSRKGRKKKEGRKNKRYGIYCSGYDVSRATIDPNFLASNCGI